MTEKPTLTKVTNEKFLSQFVPLFHDRYSDFKMGEKTIVFWQKKLYDKIPWEQFVKVYEDLLETHDKAFGLNAVFTRHRAMFPTEDPTLASKKEWKTKAVELESKMSGTNPSNIPSYARKYVEVHGRKASEVLCCKMKMADFNPPEVVQFVEEIEKVLRV